MHKIAASALFAAGTLALLCEATPAGAVELTEPLVGGNENPPVVSTGNGRFRGVIGQGVIDFTLRYNRLEDVTQAHIHVGNPGNNGGVAAFLCSPCPPAPAVVEGQIVPADVLEVLDGTTVVLEEGHLGGLVRLMRQGATYVNVHTEEHTGGEIRGQVNPRRR